MSVRTITELEIETGAKIGAVIQNTQSRSQFVGNPKATLEAIGVKADVTVLADTADLVHLVIPSTVDEARFSKGDEAYFEELGRLALGNCMYEEMPD